jgi:hypothetical protein
MHTRQAHGQREYFGRCTSQGMPGDISTATGRVFGVDVTRWANERRPPSQRAQASIYFHLVRGPAADSRVGVRSNPRMPPNTASKQHQSTSTHQRPTLNAALPAYCYPHPAHLRAALMPTPREHGAA